MCILIVFGVLFLVTLTGSDMFKEYGSLLFFPTKTQMDVSEIKRFPGGVYLKTFFLFFKRDHFFCFCFFFHSYFFRRVHFLYSSFFSQLIVWMFQFLGMLKQFFRPEKIEEFTILSGKKWQDWAGKFWNS